MGRRIRRTNRRTNLRKNTNRRNSMKRMSKKRTSIKRTSMKRRNRKTYRRTRKNNSLYGGAAISAAASAAAEAASSAGRYMKRRTPRGRTFFHPDVARREHQSSKPANKYIHDKTSRENLDDIGMTRDEAYDLLYSVFWPELLRERYGLTKQSDDSIGIYGIRNDDRYHIFNYKGGRYGANSSHPMAHTWTWSRGANPLMISISYPSDSKFLQDNVPYKAEERYNEALNCHKMIKDIEELIRSNEGNKSFINKVGDIDNDHSFITEASGQADHTTNKTMLKPHLLEIVSNLNSLPNLSDINPTYNINKVIAIVIHDLNKNDIDDIWAILECIIAYDIVYLQETTDDPRLHAPGTKNSEDNTSDYKTLRKELQKFAALHNCEIIFVGKRDNITNQLPDPGSPESGKITRIDCYYIAGLPDPSKHFGFESLRDTLVKMGQVEINYIIQGKPPSLEKFDYLESDLGILELLHDSQKQTLGLSSNVRNSGKFAEINFPKGLTIEEIEDMDEAELEAECRNVSNTSRLGYIHSALNAGDDRVEEMKGALIYFYNPTNWPQEQLDWGAASGKEPGTAGRVAPSTEAWISSINYTSAKAGRPIVNYYAIEVNDKIDRGFITGEKVNAHAHGGKMYKTSKGLNDLYDSLTNITNISLSDPPVPPHPPVNVYFYAKPKTSTAGYNNRLEISNQILIQLANTPLGKALNYQYIGGVDERTPFLKHPRIPDEGSGKNTLADLEAVLWFIEYKRRGDSAQTGTPALGASSSDTETDSLLSHHGSITTI